MRDSMKHVRLRLEPGEETIHPLFTMMTDREFVSFAQMIDWNVGNADQPTLLFAIDGDCNRIRSELDSLPHVTDYELNLVSASHCYLKVRPEPVALTRKLFEMYVKEDLLIVHPVVYRDGSARVSLLGESATLQEAVDSFSAGLSVTVEQISDFFPRSDTVVSRLSPRQQEALETALELGYYRHPRQTTHSEIAKRMGCAPNTVSVHLQKAEAKIISEVVR